MGKPPIFLYKQVLLNLKFIHVVFNLLSGIMKLFCIA